MNSDGFRHERAVSSSKRKPILGPFRFPLYSATETETASFETVPVRSFAFLEISWAFSIRD
jgi:hypothetical protein